MFCIEYLLKKNPLDGLEKKTGLFLTKNLIKQFNSLLFVCAYLSINDKAEKTGVGMIYD